MELCRQDFFNIRCRMENGDGEGRTEGDGQRIHHWEIRRRGVHRTKARKIPGAKYTVRQSPEIVTSFDSRGRDGTG